MIIINNDLSALVKTFEAYPQIYDLLEQIPFIQAQRMRHLGARVELDIPIQGNSIIDGGCATGLTLKKIAELNPKQIVGVDIAHKPLVAAKERLKTFQTAEFYMCDVCYTPFPDESFNAYISNNVVQFVTNPEKFFNEMTRVLKRGGTVSIAGPKPGFDNKKLVAAAEGSGIENQSLNHILDYQAQVEKYSGNYYEQDQITSLLRDKFGLRILVSEPAYLGEQYFILAQKK